MFERLALSLLLGVGCTTEDPTQDDTMPQTSSGPENATTMVDQASSTGSADVSISATAGVATGTTGTSTGTSGTTGIAFTSTTGNEIVDSSSSTGPICPDAPDDGGYTRCLAGFFCSGGGFCLQDTEETFEVCTRGCIDDCNCWRGPEEERDYTATPRCRNDVLMNMNDTCVLDCAGGASCPADMMCLAGLNVCVFEALAGTSTGGDTSTGGGESSTGVTSGTG